MDPQNKTTPNEKTTTEKQKTTIFKQYIKKFDITTDLKAYNTRNGGVVKFTHISDDMDDGEFVDTFKNAKLSAQLFASIEEEEKVKNDSFILFDNKKTKDNMPFFIKYNGFNRRYKNEPEEYVKARMNTFNKSKEQLVALIEETFLLNLKEPLNELKLFIDMTCYSPISIYSFNIRGGEDEERAIDFLFGELSTSTTNETTTKEQAIIEIDLLQTKPNKICNKVIAFFNNIITEKKHLPTSFFIRDINELGEEKVAILFDVLISLSKNFLNGKPFKIIATNFLKHWINPYHIREISLYNHRFFVRPKYLIDIVTNLPYLLQYDYKALEYLSLQDDLGYYQLLSILKTSMLDFFMDSSLSFLLDESNRELVIKKPFEMYPKEDLLIGQTNVVMAEEWMYTWVSLYCLRIYRDCNPSRKPTLYEDMVFFKENNTKYNNDVIGVYIGSDSLKVMNLLSRIEILPKSVDALLPYINGATRLRDEYIKNSSTWKPPEGGSVSFSSLKTSGRRKITVITNTNECEKEKWIKESVFHINNFLRTFLKNTNTKFKRHFSLKINRDNYGPDLKEKMLKAIRSTEENGLSIYDMAWSLEEMPPFFEVEKLYGQYRLRFPKNSRRKDLASLFNNDFHTMDHLGFIHRTKKAKIERLYWDPMPVKSNKN